MHFQHRILFFAALLSIPNYHAFAGDVSPRETEIRAIIARAADTDRVFLSKSVYAGEYRLSQLVTYTQDRGRLLANFHLPEALLKQFDDPAPLIIALQGSPHAWSIHRRNAGTLDTGFSLVTLTCYSPEEAWPFNRYSIASDGHNATFSAAQTQGHPSTQGHIQVNQSGRALHVSWRLESSKFITKKLDAPDLLFIPTREPVLMSSYITPVLLRLGPARSAYDVYRVFDHIPADPAITKIIEPLVLKLDANNPVDRDEALKKLVEMGRPAILSCLRLDPALLSPEQKNRLLDLYSTEGWLHVQDLESTRGDPVFLAACLWDEDQSVRLIASHTLAAVKAKKLPTK